MEYKKCKYLIYLFILGIFIFPNLLYALEWEGEVVGVKDGDTVVVYNGIKQIVIRLDGIDAPEKNQAYGRKAKDFLSNNLFNQKVRVIEQGKDKYGRTIAIVNRLNNTNVNEVMVREGFAWHYKKYSKSKKLSNLEEDARLSKKGLWRDSNPIPPWEYRKSKKTTEIKEAKIKLKKSPNKSKDEDENKIKYFGKYHLRDSNSYVSSGYGSAFSNSTKSINSPANMPNEKDLIDSSLVPSSSESESYSSNSSRYKDEHVSGYTRKDGTSVRAYDRSRRD